MSSQTDPLEGDRTGSTGRGDQQPGSAGETESEAVCVVCNEPLDETTEFTERGSVHLECEPALRCGVSLYGPED